MAIPNPYPNIADDVKSDVTTYSSNKIESLISTAKELPIPAAGDAGKVLTVNNDADGYELDIIPSELPTPEAGDAGKVLTVNSNADGYELDVIPAELPTPESGDAGKVLTVNNNADGYELKNTIFPVDRAFTSYGTTVTSATGKNFYLVLFADRLYLVWFVSTADVNVRNVGENTTATGQGSATLDGVTFTRNNDLTLTVTYSSNTSIEIIG